MKNEINLNDIRIANEQYLMDEIDKIDEQIKSVKFTKGWNNLWKVELAALEKIRKDLEKQLPKRQ